MKKNVLFIFMYAQRELFSHDYVQSQYKYEFSNNWIITRRSTRNYSQFIIYKLQTI